MHKPILFSLASLLTFNACSPEAPSSFDPTREAKPILIEAEGYQEGATHFVYDADGKLLSSEEVRVNTTSYSMRYKEDLLTEIETRSVSGGQIRIAQLTYDDADGLSVVDVFIFDEGEAMPASPYFRYVYGYDSEGFLATQTSYRGVDDESPAVMKYFWKDGEIEKAELYLNEVLEQEYFYTYDDQHNYQRLSPRAIYHPVLWSDHNVVTSELGDTSLIDVACNPCVTEYTYNEDGFPIKAVSNGGWEYNITYESAR